MYAAKLNFKERFRLFNDKWDEILLNKYKATATTELRNLKSKQQDEIMFTTVVDSNKKFLHKMDYSVITGLNKKCHYLMKQV